MIKGPENLQGVMEAWRAYEGRVVSTTSPPWLHLTLPDATFRCARLPRSRLCERGEQHAVDQVRLVSLCSVWAE